MNSGTVRCFHQVVSVIKLEQSKTENLVAQLNSGVVVNRKSKEEIKYLKLKLLLDSYQTQNLKTYLEKNVSKYAQILTLFV